MKLATWNVNSLAKRLDQVLDWLEGNEPDVLCLQETKIVDQAFPEDGFHDLGYDVAHFGEPAYNGVAIASREPLEDIVRGLSGDASDTDRRFIAATVRNVRIMNVYVPNGQALDSDKYPYKLEWLARLAAHLRATSNPADSAVLCGDFNIAPTDADVWDPEALRDGIFVSRPERRAFAEILECGFVDAFRSANENARAFSWWDYRAGSFEKNRGMRIDLILLTIPLLARCLRVRIDRDARALELPSDHAPVVLELSD